MKAPTIPFVGYKWRWATLECTEGLNAPPVFLGVLRAMRTCEGLPPSDNKFLKELETVKADTSTRVDLVRSPKRNLVRNSGQYWKAFDLIADTHGIIRLTQFGKDVADGKLTQAEFASVVIKSFELPNRNIQTDTREWDNIGLRIKPLELILNILGRLKRTNGPEEAYITPYELIHIVIPLAGENAEISKHVNAIILFRRNELNVETWPDCAPAANDKRIAREFLLFLDYYGFCRKEEASSNRKERYWLGMLEPEEVDAFMQLDTTDLSLDELADTVKQSELVAMGERRKVMTHILERPQQLQFRKQVLDAYHSTCLISGVNVPEVLEAAHIIPVKARGKDTIYNGICLRSDIHLLFDTGHLRLQDDGTIHLTDIASLDTNYGQLPARVAIPPFIKQSLLWRWKYC